MKYVFILICSVFILSASAQTFTLDSIPIGDNGSIKFERVIEAKGTKDELFTKGKLWLTFAFNTPDVIQAEDKAEGFISVKSRYPISHNVYKVKGKSVEPVNGVRLDQYNDVLFHLKMFFKDGKAKLIITDLSVKYYDDKVLTADRETIDSVRKLLLAPELKKQALGFGERDMYAVMYVKFYALLQLIESDLKKKSENDF
jgi:hypothetical protein